MVIQTEMANRDAVHEGGEHLEPVVAVGPFKVSRASGQAECEPCQCE